MAAIVNKAKEIINTVGTPKVDAKPGERIVNGFASYAPTMIPKPYTYAAAPLRPDQVELKIECCSLCHTDIAAVADQFGQSKFPFIPGHEMIGRVTNVGSQVTDLKIGMRCGVGWFREVDGTCSNCLHGHDNLCDKSVDTILQGNNGGFADYIRVQARMAIPIPDSLPSEKAAPLLCGGVTVFSPLVLNGIDTLAKRGNVTVGLIGFGGLGHMYVKMAKAMGCRVVVFSTSPEKQEDATLMGADDFVYESDKDAIKRMHESIDFLLSTVYVPRDWSMYLDLVKPNGTLCLVGWVPLSKNIEIPPFPLIYRQKRVIGSNVGSVPTLKKMLQFCAEHQIYPETEVYSISEFPEKFQLFQNSPRDLRYRMVFRMDDMMMGKEQ